MVSKIQGERILSEAVLIGLCDIDDLVQNVTESEPVDESFIQYYGRLGHLGDKKW